jgi:hypothetical protein
VQVDWIANAEAEPVGLGWKSGKLNVQPRRPGLIGEHAGHRQHVGGPIGQLHSGQAGVDVGAEVEDDGPGRDVEGGTVWGVTVDKEGVR